MPKPPFRRSSGPRQAAETAFKSATTKSTDPAERPKTITLPPMRELVSCASTKTCWSTSKPKAPAGRRGSTRRSGQQRGSQSLTLRARAFTPISPRMRVMGSPWASSSSRRTIPNWAQG